MAIERTEVLVVGAGQAGIAMSEHLSAARIPHLVLERDRVAERWRSARWDSLVANGPAWHDRFPNMEFPEDGPDAFPPKERVADYLAAYARKIEAPIRTGIEVRSVARLQGRAGFRVETSAGPLETANVVAATGAFQIPAIPPLVPESEALTQLHSSSYRNPAALPRGGVLVVGAGSSGAQIAQELLEAGRDVTLAVGPHDRPPRSYRGRDFVWWLGVLNKWDMETSPEAEHTTIAVSGAHGGRTVDFRRLAHQGMTLVGKAESYAEGVMRFAPDLARNIAGGDAYLMNLLDEADAWVARAGADLPPEPEARVLPSDPEDLARPIRSLDLAGTGIRTIIWATGFRSDYSWLPEAATDEAGRPAHQRGVSAEPGVYYLGLPWQTRRGSAFIWGCWHDARYLTDHIAKQRVYLDYAPAASSADASLPA